MATTDSLDPGNVFDLKPSLADVVERPQSMDKRRSIEALLRVRKRAAGKMSGGVIGPGSIIRCRWRIFSQRAAASVPARSVVAFGEMEGQRPER